MKTFVAMVAALALALGVTGFVTQATAQAQPAGAPHGFVAAQPRPEATKTKKAKKKPKATPTPTPSATPTPTPSARVRTAAELEGDRWVQIALIAGGGLLGSVFAFFGVGALMRRGRRRRN